MNDNDNLPQSICEVCLQDVLKACETKRKCIESDQHLRRELSENELNCVVEIIEDKPKSHSQKQKTLADVTFKSSKRQSQRKRAPESLNNRRELRKPSSNDFLCFICNAQFEMIKNKNEHILTEHAAIDRCRICDRVCKTPAAVERHIKAHFVKDNIFLCPFCALTFNKKHSLERHLLQVHGNSAPQFHCDLCPDWKTKFLTNLRRHMLTVHLQIKMHKCPFSDSCPDKFFTTKDTLNFHLAGHHDFLFIKCGRCSQKFDNEADLDDHQASDRCIQRTVRRRHRNTNSAALEDSMMGISCEVCKKIFETKTQFNVHYHQKHKSSLKCEVCGKEFTQYANLLRHIKVEEMNSTLN